MKIQEILVEAPLDTPLDPAGTAVGQGVGKAGYGVGYAAGKIASKLPGSGKTNPNISNKNRSPSLLKGLVRGVKSGVYKYGTQGSSLLKSYEKGDQGDVAYRIAAGKKVTQDELNDLIKDLPNLKVSWKVDINAAKTALNKAANGEQLYGSDQNALKTLAADLKKA